VPKNEGELCPLSLTLSNSSTENISMPEDSVKNGELIRSSGVVSLLTMVSRVFGLLRDVVIANVFGSGAGADAFFVALRIPNLFRRLFAEGAFSQAFVPVLSAYRERRTRSEVRLLVSRVSGTLGLSLLLITILGVLGAEYIMRIFAFGYVYHAETEKLALATEMLRLTFPYLLLISLTAFAGAILNTYGRFAVPAFTPVLLNLSLIVCVIALRPYLDQPIMALAWAVLVAGVAQLTMQLPFLAKEDLLVAPTIHTKDPGVRRILTLMLPALFGVSVGQINILLDTVLASFLETGTLSWLWYSDRLLELPLGIFAIAIATVILPGLSQDHATASKQQFSHTLNWALRLVCLLGLPASAALIYLSDELIATLFFHGAMTERDVTMSGLALAAYGTGLLGHMLVKVLLPGYFARQDTSTPVKFGVIALFSNMILNLALIWHFKHAGLALATSFSAFINAGLLVYGLKSSGVLVFEAEWGRFFFRILIATLIMLSIVSLITPNIENWFEFGNLERVLRMLFICFVGIGFYIIGLLVLGIKVNQVIR